MSLPFALHPWWTVSLGVVLCLGICAALALQSPDVPPPSGPHSVGTRLITLPGSPVDSGSSTDSGNAAESRPEAQRLSLRAFYPTDASSGQRARRMDNRVSQAFAQFNSMPSLGGEEPLSAAWRNAPPKQSQTYPVVLFLHGAFSFTDQNFTSLVDLASHGFVVFALSHPGESVLTIFEDDTTQPINPRLQGAMALMKEGSEKNGPAFVAALDRLIHSKTRKEATGASQTLGKIYLAMFGNLPISLPTLVDTRVAHLTRVREAIETEATRTELFGDLAPLLDPSRLGLLGHSLGAFSSLRYLQQSDSPVPIVALDVPYFAFDDAPPAPIKTPLLGLGADTTKLPGGLDAHTAGGLRPVLDEATPLDAQVQLKLEGTSHMNFTDMNFLPRFLSWLGVLGPIHGARAAFLMNTATAGFFNEHLKGSSSAWLSKLEQHPEVTRLP